MNMYHFFIYIIPSVNETLRHSLPKKIHYVWGTQKYIYQLHSYPLAFLYVKLNFFKHNLFFSEKTCWFNSTCPCMTPTNAVYLSHMKVNTLIMHKNFEKLYIMLIFIKKVTLHFLSIIVRRSKLKHCQCHCYFWILYYFYREFVFYKFRMKYLFYNFKILIKTKYLRNSSSDVMILEWIGTVTLFWTSLHIFN